MERCLRRRPSDQIIDAEGLARFYGLDEAKNFIATATGPNHFAESRQLLQLDALVALIHGVNHHPAEIGHILDALAHASARSQHRSIFISQGCL